MGLVKISGLELGRFAQADSIISDPYNPQSLNRYSYVLNNPLKYTDPTGHCVPEECGDAYGDVADIYVDPQANSGPSGNDAPAQTGGQQVPAAPPVNPTDYFRFPIWGTPTPRAPSIRGTTPSDSNANKKRRPWSDWLPDATIISFGPLVGAVNQYGFTSFDTVIQHETDRQWQGRSYKDSRPDTDFVSPQAGASVTWGWYWNLDSPEDYFGGSNVYGFSYVSGTLGLESYDNEKTWGVFAGGDAGVPWAGFYQIHATSRPEQWNPFFPPDVHP